MRCIGSCGNDCLNRGSSEKGRKHIGQGRNHGQVIDVVISTGCHSCGNSAEGNVGTNVQADHTECAENYVGIDCKFLADKFIILYDNAGFLFVEKCIGNAGCYNGNDDGINQGIGTVFGKVIGDQCCGQGNTAGNGITLDHIDRGLYQNDTDTGHHSIGNILTYKVYDFCQQSKRSDQSHNHTADKNHRTAFRTVFSSRSGVSDRLRLEGNWCDTLRNRIAHRTNKECQRRRNRCKSKRQSKKTLRQTIQHNADDCQKIC